MLSNHCCFYGNWYYAIQHEKIILWWAETNIVKKLINETIDDTDPSIIHLLSQILHLDCFNHFSLGITWKELYDIRLVIQTPLGVTDRLFAKYWFFLIFFQFS